MTQSMKSASSHVLEGFDRLWQSLFQEPVHLDSLLAKQSPKLKSILAQIAPSILLRPCSQAESLGVGVSPGEPWSLSPEKLAVWRAAHLMAERIYLGMSGKAKSSTGSKEDFPPHLIEEWIQSFGEQTAEELIQILTQEPPLSLRASRKIGAEALLKGLSKGDQLPVRIERSDVSPMGVRLSGYVPVMGTEWYERGEFEIQDEGSQFMAFFALWPELFGPLLQTKPGKVLQKVEKVCRFEDLPSEDLPGWTVVDACAGAGGKSLALADAMKGRGRIYAYDISLKKLQALRRRATRGSYTNIQTVAVTEGKESETIKKFRRRADVVLVDAPCTGWGVLRRNPDIKWRQTSDVLQKMPQIQSRILSEYSELVAPGGRLVFGVCTFRTSETVDQVKEFLSRHSDFIAGPGGYLGPGPCDGFFMQAFERKR